MKDNRKYVIKIIDFCNNIMEYTNGYTFDEFIKDSKTFNACVMCICQIGELSKKFSQEFCEKYNFIDWYSIKGTRNILVHDYDGINNKIVWEIITENIPKLKSELIVILNEL